MQNDGLTLQTVVLYLYIKRRRNNCIVLIRDVKLLSCSLRLSRTGKSPDLLVEALCSRYLSSRAVARQVLSAYMSLTSVFGMGTGGPS